MDKLKKCLFILRCHHFGEAESFLLGSVLSYFGKDNILVVADERLHSVNVNEWKKTTLTNEKLRNMGILEHPNCGWLCGDYFFYIAHEECPNYDYYWLCEPDVYFSFQHIEDFFNQFDENNSDLLAPRLEKKGRSWFWTSRAQIISKNVYGCLFPTTRLSSKAIKHLRNQRKSLTSLFINKNLPLEQWPNDESFVCTTLQQVEFVCQNLNSICNFFAFDFGFNPILWDMAISGKALNRVLHPVLHNARYQQKFLKSFRKFINPIKNNFNKKKLLNTTEDVAFDICLNSLNIFYNEIREALLTEHPKLLANEISQIDLAFENIQHLKKVTTKQHFINERYRKSKFDNARYTDFVLSGARLFDEFDGKGFSPYAFDYLNKIFYLSQNNKKINEKPFFYQAQFDTATSIVTLPLNIAEEVYGEYTRTLQPTFIFSIGRCGSTLLSRLTQCVNKINVSEPDIFTTFIFNRNKITPYEADRVLFYTVKSLEKFFEVTDSQLVIKFRSGCNKICKEIYRNFPFANYIFITREIYPWSKSFIQAFNFNTSQLFNTLVSFIDTLCFFKENEIAIYLISYENLISNPIETLKILSGENTLDIDSQLMDSILSEHSQLGTGLDTKTNETASKVETRAKEFEVFWEQNKPVEKLAYLGITL